MNNIPKNSSTFSNKSKIGVVDEYNLLIDSTYSLLIDSTYKLNIQDAGSGTVWANKSKS